MKRVVIIQARMTSTRLPGKVLQEIDGKPMLERQILRLRRCRSVDDILIATTVNGTDDPLVDLANRLSVPYFRGSEDDVLSRYVGAAQSVNAEVIVRVTSDCPLICAEVIDLIIDELIANKFRCDYASNVIQRAYPRGQDAEAFFYDTLLRMDRLSVSQASREHVTVALRSEIPHLFTKVDVMDSEDNSDLRWTVDTPADLELVRRIYEGLDLSNRYVPYKDMLAYVRSRPELCSVDEAHKTWDPTRRSE